MKLFIGILFFFITIVVIQTCKGFPFHRSTIPEQIAIAYAGHDGMAFTWYTHGKIPIASIWYGETADNLKEFSIGDSVHLGEIFSGYQHSVKIDQLKYSTKYYYKVGNPGSGVSEIYTFVSGRKPGDSKYFKIAVVGDMGLVNSQGTINQMIQKKSEIDFVLHLGDMSYADDAVLSLDTYHNKWNTFKNKMQPLSSEKPYMVLPGNHEATCIEVGSFLCPHSLRNFSHYRKRYRMPFKESNAVNNMWYSFDYGLVHFIQIDTETDFIGAPEGLGTKMESGPFGPQLEWLQADLKKAFANRKTIPWIVVSGHRPLYTASLANEKPCEPCRIVFEKLMLKYSVDLYLSGHVHWYERTFPVKQRERTQNNYEDVVAPVYIVSGSGGNVEGHDILNYDAKQNWLAYINDKNFGHGELEVFNATHLNWNFLRASDGVVIDSFLLTKKR